MKKAKFLQGEGRYLNVLPPEAHRPSIGAMNEFIATRSNFLSKVSHELRSPLQSIVSALDVFEMRHGHGVVAVAVEVRMLGKHDVAFEVKLLRSFSGWTELAARGKMYSTGSSTVMMR